MLRVPISSQTLVFSKTSCQADYTSPRSPRAIYNNGEVYVGWAQGAPDLDVIDIDPKKGPIFYTLGQASAGRPEFTRQTTCMRCHLNLKTYDVPGLMLRSNLTGPEGRPISQVTNFIVGHNSPLNERWGGWYVTGTHAADVHLGNLISTDRTMPTAAALKATSNVTDLSGYFDTSKYLATSSDTVALSILDHTTRIQNLITHAQYETQFMLHAPAGVDASWRIVNTAEPLLASLLLCDEAPLHGRIEGTTKFADEFVRAGPKDSRGRSLRDLDLTSRLFRFRCSYMIYSTGFDGLPKPMKEYLWQRLETILAGKDPSPVYKDFSAEDRQAVLEILTDTKPEFKAFLHSHSPPK